MAVINRREKSDNTVKDIVDGINNPKKEEKTKISFDKVISTGSTLLDLCISGGRKTGGGVPGGTVIEVYGPPGSGKTAVLAEMAASAQINKGDVEFLDPEGRLDKEYSRIYGLQIDKKNYHMPDTVKEVFEKINGWEVKNQNAINLVATDSLAALSTEMEMEKEDKMGMRRAKEFSQGFRKSARKIKKNNLLIACSNQMRDGEYGDVTPGGQAIKFYSSVRCSIKQVGKVLKTTKFEGKEIKKVIGIESECIVVKNSIDDPYRKCSIFIVFRHGVDDIRGNLQYIKDTMNLTTYRCPDGKTYQSMENAIEYVERNNLEERLREQTIDLWEEVEARLEVTRKEKKRR